MKDLIGKIDVAGQVRKFKLKNADARTLAKKLGKPIAGVDYLTADPTDNSIVARGTLQALAKLAKRISKLDKR